MTSGWQRTRPACKKRRFRPTYVGGPTVVRRFHGFVIDPTIEQSFFTLLRNRTHVALRVRVGVNCRATSLRAYECRQRKWGHPADCRSFLRVEHHSVCCVTQFGSCSWVGKHSMKRATKEVHLFYSEAPRWPRYMYHQQEETKRKNSKGLPDQH